MCILRKTIMYNVYKFQEFLENSKFFSEEIETPF